jgi:hypothetical protein
MSIRDEVIKSLEEAVDVARQIPDTDFDPDRWGDVLEKVNAPAEAVAIMNELCQSSRQERRDNWANDTSEALEALGYCVPEPVEVDGPADDWDDDWDDEDEDC